MRLEMIGTATEEVHDNPFIDHVNFILNNGKRIHIDRNETMFSCKKDEDGVVHIDILFRSIYLLKGDGVSYKEIYPPNEYHERLNKIVADADIELIIDNDCPQDNLNYDIKEWSIYC